MLANAGASTLLLIAAVILCIVAAERFIRSSAIAAAIPAALAIAFYALSLRM